MCAHGLLQGQLVSLCLGEVNLLSVLFCVLSLVKVDIIVFLDL